MQGLLPHTTRLSTQIGYRIQHSAPHLGVHSLRHVEQARKHRGRRAYEETLSLWGAGATVSRDNSRRHSMSCSGDLSRIALLTVLPADYCFPVLFSWLLHSFFLVPPPKSITRTQILISGSAFKRTQIKAFHYLSLGNFQKYKLEML